MLDDKNGLGARHEYAGLAVVMRAGGDAYASATDGLGGLDAIGTASAFTHGHAVAQDDPGAGDLFDVASAFVRAGDDGHALGPDGHGATDPFAASDAGAAAALDAFAPALDAAGPLQPDRVPVERVNFEGLVTGTDHLQLTDYDGFTWSGMGVIGKNWALKNGYGSDTGFTNIAHGHAVAYTLDDNGVSDAMFTSDGGTFTLKSGYFASAWFHDGESVTFTAWLGGVAVAIETVVLTTEGVHLDFNKKFEHVDAVEISAVSATGDDSNVVMDNLKVVFDTPHDWIG